MRALRWMFPALLSIALLSLALTACGPAKKSVFPPSVSVQQLKVLPNGQWRLTLRIQNNSYGEMDFRTLDGQLQMAQSVPIRLHAKFVLDIPSLAGDVLDLDVLPTAPMTQAISAIAGKGSSASIGYRVSGSTSAKPEQEKDQRDFEFSGDDRLSPVPGIPDTYR